MESLPGGGRGRLRPRGTALALAACLTLALPAAPGARAADVAAAPEEPVAPFTIPRATSPVKVDGFLQEPAWEEALRLPLEFETFPGENVPPPVETVCLLLYDSDRLYVAFRALDPEPSAIRAHLSDRDTAFSDDFVGVVLDPFNDERRAFEFFVNPLGVQMDLFQDDVSGDEDEAWDAIWDSAGRLTDEGYVVEFAIPFHQLRFRAQDGPQTWGLDALRFYPRDQRHRISIHPLDRDVDCYLCQESKLAGFEGITPGRNLEVVPTLTGGRTDERQDFPAGDLESGDLDAEVGLSVKWGVTPNLILNGTLNPDFSQVEADVAQLEINTTFALFFPEKRPFFLEGADFFSTPLNIVFTRNVADPDWGAKVTGKQGKNALGLFAARDAVTNLIFPGSQGSDATSLDSGSDDLVLRYRRDFGDSSAVGVLATSREGAGYSNRVAGIDGLYRFTEADSVRFQWLSSRTEYPQAVASEFGQPAGAFSDHAASLAYDHRTRNWFWFGRFQDIGKGFRADMGFVPQVDRRFLLGGAQRIWWGDEDDWWTRASVRGFVSRSEEQSGQLLEERQEVRAALSGPLQSFTFLNLLRRRRFFNGRTFDQRVTRAFFELEPSGTLSFGLFAQLGDQIDFANTRAADELLLEPRLRLNLGRHLRLQLEHTFQRLDVEGGRLFEANLSQLRLVYQLNVRTFVRLITQYTRIDRDPALFLDEVEARSESLFNQLLFSYKVDPQTVIFVGYADNRSGTAALPLTQSDRTLFLKLGYAWTL